MSFISLRKTMLCTKISYCEIEENIIDIIEIIYRYCKTSWWSERRRPSYEYHLFLLLCKLIFFTKITAINVRLSPCWLQSLICVTGRFIQRALFAHGVTFVRIKSAVLTTRVGTEEEMRIQFPRRFRLGKMKVETDRVTRSSCCFFFLRIPLD